MSVTVLLSRPFSGLETETETGQNELESALESRDHGLEITSLGAPIPIGDRAFA